MPFRGKVRPIDVGDSIEFDGVRLTAIETQHGPIEYNILGLKRTMTPGPDEHAGFGSIGFTIQIGRLSLVNLGDSLLQKEWEGLSPDVAMLPKGGLGNDIWTMDAADALEAVRLMSPKLVIPCHDNVPFVWWKRMAAADAQGFKRDEERMGVECRIMGARDCVEI